STRTARRAREYVRAKVVLADGIRREIHAELWHLPQHECRERVGVRPRPDAIGVVVWVRCDRVRDALDERIHAGAAHVGPKIGRAAEPRAVRGALADRDRAAAAANAKACHLIHGEGRSIGRLGRNPRMYAEVAAPSDRARRVHLYHRLWS